MISECTIIWESDLLEAIHHGERERVTAALTADPALISAADDEGMTLLHKAVVAEQPAIVALLLAYPEVPLDAPQLSHRRTPLHIAAIRSATRIIHLLVDAGANVFATDTQGLRPLDLAGKKPAITALRLPTLFPERAFRQAIMAGALVRVQRQLAASPALLEATDADGRTPLHWAVCAGRLPMMEAMLAAGIPIDAPDQSERTPLHEAIRRGNLLLTRALLAAGADPRVADYQGITPLHLAAGHGNAARPLAPPPLPGDIVPAANAAPPPPDQCTFFFAAAVAAPPAASPPPSSALSSRDYRDLAAMLLDAGAAVDARARGGITPLHLAADRGDRPLVKLLLAHHARTDLELTLWPATPAHVAAARGYTSIERLLKRRRVEVNTKTQRHEGTKEI